MIVRLPRHAFCVTPIFTVPPYSIALRREMNVRETGAAREIAAIMRGRGEVLHFSRFVSAPNCLQRYRGAHVQGLAVGCRSPTSSATPATSWSRRRRRVTCPLFYDSADVNPQPRLKSRYVRECQQRRPTNAARRFCRYVAMSASMFCMW